VSKIRPTALRRFRRLTCARTCLTLTVNADTAGPARHSVIGEKRAEPVERQIKVYLLGLSIDCRCSPVHVLHTCTLVESNVGEFNVIMNI
jgi:hypothetical protein